MNSGILPRNKENSFWIYKLVKTNCILQENYSQFMKVIDMGSESNWIKENAGLDMNYYHKDELHFIEDGYKNFANSTFKILSLKPNIRIKDTLHLTLLSVKTFTSNSSWKAVTP